MEELKTILINDRYLIYNDGVIYDTLKAQDIPKWVFEIRNKVIGDNEAIYNEFMELIGKYKNYDLLKLGNSLIEYVENDKE